MSYCQFLNSILYTKEGIRMFCSHGAKKSNKSKFFSLSCLCAINISLTPNPVLCEAQTAKWGANLSVKSTSVSVTSPALNAGIA